MTKKTNLVRLLINMFFKKTKEKRLLSLIVAGQRLFSGIELTNSKFSRENLSRIDLSSANLSNADMSAAKLEFTVLHDAILDDANFESAFLRSANLSKIKCSGTKFLHAELSESNLSHAFGSIVCTGATLLECNLRYAFLGGSDMRAANLSMADASNANFENANLCGAILSKTILRDTNLGGSDMRAANLSMADASNANFENANLCGAILNKTILRDTNLQGADLSKIKFIDIQFSSQTNFSKTKLHGSELTYAQLTGVQFQHSAMHDASLYGANMTNSDLSFSNIKNTNFEYSILSGAKLSGATLRECNLRSSNLSGAVLQKANLSHSLLSHANLEGADLTYADLSYADLRGANLTNANLSCAILEHTILDDAIIQKATLHKVTIYNASLRRADLQNAKLKGAKIVSANFTDANLKGTILDNAVIEKTFFDNAKFPNISMNCVKVTNSTLTTSDFSSNKFYDVIFLHCNFRNAEFSNSKFDKIVLTDCNLSSVKFRNGLLNNTFITSSNFTNSDFYASKMVGGECKNSNFSEAKMAGSSFTEVDMSNCNFNRADLENATLVSCVLAHVSFFGSNLTSARLTGANLSNVNFKQCNAEDADFSGANLDQAELAEAILRGAKLFNTKGRIKSKADAKINYKTYVNSSWPANILADWHVSGALIEDFEAFPEDVQDACLGDRTGLTLYFSKSIGVFNRFLIETIIFHVLGISTKCKVTDFRERDKTAYVRIHSDNPTDLELVAEALYREIWERQHSSTADELIRVNDIVLTENYRQGLRDLRKHLDRMELRVTDHSENRSSLLWAWTTLMAGQPQALEFPGNNPFRVTTLLHPSDNLVYGISAIISRLADDRLIDILSDNLDVICENKSINIPEIVIAVVSKTFLENDKFKKLLDKCLALWRQGLLRILPINVDCDNWRLLGINEVKPINRQMLTDLLPAKLNETIDNHLRLALRIILHRRQEIDQVARFLPKSLNEKNNTGVFQMERKKILFLASNPTLTKHIAIDEEARDIEQKLQAVTHRDSFQFITRWAVRPDDLQDALLRDQPTIVHFSGHGNGVPGLVLHGDAASEDALVSAEALQHLFSVLRDNIRIVVLNACYSEQQATAIVDTIDFVVGMKDSISDKAARFFAASFYRGLGFGRSVQTAFDLGVNAIKLQGLVLDRDLPVLLVRQNVDASRVFLAQGNEAAEMQAH